jgi:aldose sugar dehydrogenase
LWSIYIITSLLILFFFTSHLNITFVYNSREEPFVYDPNLKVQTLVKGLESPTTMAFVDKDNILVLEKNNGTVKRIVNGVLLAEPVLDVNIANAHERGMLGIATFPEEDFVKNTTQNTRYVFLYYSTSENLKRDGDDECLRTNSCEEPYPIFNHLYRYEWQDDKLVNPKLLLTLPATPGSEHMGGALSMGPDGNLYVVVGDGQGCQRYYCYQNFTNSLLNSVTSNFENGTQPLGRGGILTISQNGQDTGYNIFGETHPINKYYSYGLRNSFGIDFDPITNKLWDTENGPGFGDEINLVEPGFNSGWAKVQGIWPNQEGQMGDGAVPNYTATPEKFGFFDSKQNITNPISNLVDFNGKGKYSSPEFSWNVTVGPTALKFYSSEKLGKHYENDLFVGDYGNGYIYHFELNKERSELVLTGKLQDKIANSQDELQDIIFGEGFEKITDIEVGPDGYIYIVSYGRGEIYRIVPNVQPFLFGFV